MPSPLSRILVVEDEPDIQAVVRLTLAQLGGFQVEICGCGADALERAPVFAPDLILLDVMMPAMDGPSTLQALRARGVTTPAIFMTAKAQPHEVAQYKALGALDVVTKPFDPMALPGHLRSIWEAHHA
jgi:CheY-like chemotaxis protein